MDREEKKKHKQDENVDDQQTERGTLSKQNSEDLMRPTTARVI
jgi:hypothetical protein